MRKYGSLDSTQSTLHNLIYTYFSLDNKIYIEFATMHGITQSFLPQDKIFVEILYCWHRVCSLYRISIPYSEFCIVDKSEQEYFCKQKRSGHPMSQKISQVYDKVCIQKIFKLFYNSQYIKVLSLMCHSIFRIQFLSSPSACGRAELLRTEITPQNGSIFLFQNS